MKIVIDIPEEVYKSIQDNDYCGISNSDMYNAVKNGTPLSTDGDLISRDSAIELVNYALAENKDVLEVLENMPSAEPKTGRWIPIDDFPHEVWECDHCGFVIDGSGCIEPTEYRDLYSFCPNCGSKMKGE